VTDETRSGASPVLVGGGLAAGLIVLALLVLPAPDTSDDNTAATTEAPALDTPGVADAPALDSAQADAPAGRDAPQVMPSPDADADAADPAATTADTADSAPQVAAQAPAVPDVQGPDFDTFRVETDGAIVIAGRTTPGQTVDVVLGGKAIDRVTADDTGAFVSFPMAGPSDQPRRLVLVADPEGVAIESTTSYIVAPIAAPVVVAEAEAAQVADPSEASPEVGADSPQAPAPPVADGLAAAEDTASPEVETTSGEAPTVLQTDSDGVRIVQGAQTEATDNVALDAITYDPEGAVQLSGRASAADGEVQVYIDNRPLAAAPITGGDWRLDLPQVDTGVYTLRVDEVDTQGDVVSRIETPFRREEPAQVAAVMAEETAQEGFEAAVRTVQPGATLWAIAEDTLGDGILYVEVFEANRDLIRDPDLIYPGQIFRIPGSDE